jgi:hypothetical protein
MHTLGVSEYCGGYCRRLVPRADHDFGTSESDSESGTGAGGPRPRTNRGGGCDQAPVPGKSGAEMGTGIGVHPQWAHGSAGALIE